MKTRRPAKFRRPIPTTPYRYRSGGGFRVIKKGLPK